MTRRASSSEGAKIIWCCNQPLTLFNLEELKRMLIKAGGTKEAIERAIQGSHGLGLFIRTPVGLDHETAELAFVQFISGTVVSANQMEFINLIVNFLTENGVIKTVRLYEFPFTDVNLQGP